MKRRQPTRHDLVFFLGGHDLEMDTIRELLERRAAGRWHDRGLAWGARASAYREEIEAALAAGETPVLVELEDDVGLDGRCVVIVDHHGESAGAERPTSLEQVFAWLALPPGEWTRWHELVAANDRGYIPALVEAGASIEEIREVRAADRGAQGITEAEERAAQGVAKRGAGSRRRVADRRRVATRADSGADGSAGTSVGRRRL